MAQSVNFPVSIDPVSIDLRRRFCTVLYFNQENWSRTDKRKKIPQFGFHWRTTSTENKAITLQSRAVVKAIRLKDQKTEKLKD